MDTSVLNLFVYITLWLITLIIHQKKKKYFGASSFVLASFLVYSIISFVWYNSISYSKPKLTLFPFVYLYVALIIACMPILKYNEKKISHFVHPSKHFVYGFVLIYVICALVQIPGIIGNMSNGITALLVNSDMGAEMYNELNKSSTRALGGISNIFAIFYNSFSDVSIIFFFYFWAFYPKMKKIILLLSFCLVVQILGSISMGGRTETTMKILSVIVAFVTMRHFLSEKQRRLSYICGAIFIGFVVLLFASLTISRFSERSEGIEGGTFYYVGQGNLNFNTHVLSETHVRNGDRTANTFKYLLGFDVPNGIQATRLKYGYMKIDDSIFSTFVGDFVLDYGPIITIILFVLFSTLFCHITRIRSGKIYMHQLIALYFCMCVVTQGGFYLFNYSFSRNLTILAFFILYIYFYIDSRALMSDKRTKTL